MKIFRHYYFLGEDGAVVFVAIEGAVDDWAAYVGSAPYSTREEDAVKLVALHGCKLPKSWAEAIFPGVDLVYRV